MAWEQWALVFLPLGAAIGNPDQHVVCVTSEGSIQMNIQELGTCMQHNIPVTIVCLNNSFLGMVKQWQELFHGERYSSVHMEIQPDFIKLVEAYNQQGIRIDDPALVEPTLRKALERTDKGILFIDILVDRSENVFPMIAAGKGLSEMTFRKT